MASKRGHFFQNQIFVPSLEARWSRRATPLAIIIGILCSIHKLIQVRKRKRSKEGLLNEIFDNLIEQEPVLPTPKQVSWQTDTPRNRVSQKMDATKKCCHGHKKRCLQDNIIDTSWCVMSLSQCCPYQNRCLHVPVYGT